MMHSVIYGTETQIWIHCHTVALYFVFWSYCNALFLCCLIFLKCFFLKYQITDKTFEIDKRRLMYFYKVAAGKMKSRICRSAVHRSSWHHDDPIMMMITTMPSSSPSPRLQSRCNLTGRQLDSVRQSESTNRFSVFSAEKNDASHPSCDADANLVYFLANKKQSTAYLHVSDYQTVTLLMSHGRCTCPPSCLPPP